jgi:hypothetical protein
MIGPLTITVLRENWAAIHDASGRRVRVTVELAPEPEPEPRCPFCGGKVRQDTRVCEGESHWASWDVKCIARCCQCDAYGEGPTHQAALDDLAEWLDVCPRCGGKAEYKNDWYMIPGEEGRIRYWHWAICTDKKCGVRSPQCDSKPEVAQWWYKRRGCK